MVSSSFIPCNLPSIGDDEIKEVISTLRSGWLTTGPKTAQFEQEFRDYVRSPHALAVNSATAGLHLALTALKIGPGDEIITTPLTFCSTVGTILHVGATPVLADIGDDGNIDPDAIAERVTSRTRAVIPVHLSGLPCQMDAIWDLARKKELLVVEDAAQAVGSYYHGLPIGGVDPSIGAGSDAVAFSFYATQNLTTGEGGMVTTHHRWLDESMRTLCLHGISKDAWNQYSMEGRCFHQVITSGFKYNLTDIHAAIGIHQLRRLEGFVKIRKQYSSMYNLAFGDVPELEIPSDDSCCRHSWHLYSLKLNLDKLEITREEFIRLLKTKNIGASVHFSAIPMHPYFAQFAGLQQNQCPRALELYPRLVALPLYPAMTEEQVWYVAKSVIEIVRAARKTEMIAVSNESNKGKCLMSRIA